MAEIAIRQADLIVDNKAIYLHPSMKEHKNVEVKPGEYRLVHSPRSGFSRLCDFFDSANGGPFRLGQLGDRIFKLLNIVHPNENTKNLSTMFNKMWTVTIIPRLFSVNAEAVKSVKGLDKPTADSEAARRKYMKAIHDVTDAGSAWGYSASCVLGCFKKTAETSMTVLKAADTVTFVHDLSDLQMNAEDWNKSRVLAGKAQQLNANDAVQETIADTRSYHMFKALKAVCSVAGFILGLSMTALGAPILGLAIVAATISLASTVFAMSASLKEEGMKYEKIKFFNQKHVQHLLV